METIRILIADDHPVVRHGLRRIVEESPGLLVAGEADSGEAAVEQATRLALDIVLLDVSMPGPGMLETLGRIRAARPRLPILVLSVHPEDQYGIRAMRAGAAGYLTKDNSPDELVAAIRQVMRGIPYVSPALAEALRARSGEKRGTVEAGLSDREHQVLVLLGEGRTIGEIALGLELSPKTVSTYRTRLIEKLRLRTSGDLIRYAVRHGLVP